MERVREIDKTPDSKFEKSESDFETHYSDIDASCVDYVKGTNTFEIFFDKILYEPPKIILEKEKKLAAQKTQNKL